MNIQIFGKNKCFDTKKAERYFKERKIKYQLINMAEKGMSKGEYNSVKQAVGGYEQLIDSRKQVEVGDKVVTSNISDKYLPGILIGYISSMGQDSNNITKSGKLTPAVDFEHLEEVLVILKTKQQIAD